MLQFKDGQGREVAARASWLAYGFGLPSRTTGDNVGSKPGTPAFDFPFRRDSAF